MFETHERGVSPERILAVTFSRKATQEMEDRLAEASVSLAEKVQIKTLHSLGLEIVEKHGFRLGLGKRPQLISETQAQLFLRKLTDSLPLLPLLKTSSIDPILDDLLDFFSQCKDAGLWPEDVMRYALALPDDTPDLAQIKSEWSALGDIYNAFQSRCFEEGFLDFGDCLLLARRILEEFAIVRNEMQEAYSSILVDEFQDTNWAQIQFLKLLTNDTTRITAVGDDDQSIYRFRGASYSAFSFFIEAFPGTEVIELTETYRLPATIAEAATCLIQGNGARRFRPNKAIVSKSIEAGKVSWLRTTSEGHEAQVIARAIQEKLKSGSQPEEIAVLVRSHSHASLIREELKQLNISFSENSRRDLLEDTHVRDCMALLQVLADPNNSLSFYRLLDSFFLEIPAHEIYVFCQKADQKKDLMSALRESGGKLAEWAQLLEELTKQSLSTRPSELLLSAFEKTSVLKRLAAQNPAQLRNIGLFFSELSLWEEIQPQRELRAIMPMLSAVTDLSSQIQSTEETNAADRISILTTHASKGLEFNHVFIPSLVSRRFPSLLKKPVWTLPAELNRESAFNLELHQDEERRLFYVGMTRAKKTLTLSSFEKKGTRPSIFITQDLKDLIESHKIVTNSFLDEKFLEKPLVERIPFSRATQKTQPPAKSISTKPLSLSYTQLEKYETCPLSYQFKYDFRIPVRVPVQMSVGSAIHKALELFFGRVQQDESPTKEDLLLYFEKAFDEEKSKTPALNETHRRLGLEKLSHYFDHHRGQFPKPFAIEQDFILPIGQHKIRGKIDRVDKNKDGYRIIDYKTGRSRSNDKTEDQKFAKESLQFSIYALAAKEVFNWPLQELIFDYVYDCKTLSTTRSVDNLSTVKDKIQEIATHIQQRDFQATPGFHCQWCEYREICPSGV